MLASTPSAHQRSSTRHQLTLEHQSKYHRTITVNNNEDSRKQLDMLSFEEMIFINKAKIMYKVATNISPIYLTKTFQLRGSF